MSEATRLESWKRKSSPMVISWITYSKRTSHFILSFTTSFKWKASIRLWFWIRGISIIWSYLMSDDIGPSCGHLIIVCLKRLRVPVCKHCVVLNTMLPEWLPLFAVSIYKLKNWGQVLNSVSYNVSVTNVTTKVAFQSPKICQAGSPAIVLSMNRPPSLRILWPFR